MEAAHAAEWAVRIEREQFVADVSLGDVLVQAGDLAGAKARFDESLKVSEQVAE